VTAEFEAAGHRVTGTSTAGGETLVALDLSQPQQVEQALSATRPDVLVHLAGIQSIPLSWQDPSAVLAVNTGGTAALLRAMESSSPRTHLLLASTAAVYGMPSSAGAEYGGRAKPFEESDPVAPESPYGASKAAAEVLVGESAARTGLPVTVARLFNQFGPDQPESQLPASLAASIAAAEAEGKDAVELEVGNPGARRDYTDTRETARALRLLAEGRVTGTFNCCHGQTEPLSRLVEGLSQASRIEARIDHRPERANRNDVAEIAGSPARLEAATGWKPRISLDETLTEMLEFRRRALRGN